MRCRRGPGIDAQGQPVASPEYSVARVVIIIIIIIIIININYY